MIALTELHGCLVLSALMFGLGLTAAFTRRNTILVLIGVELMLNAANINFIAFWRHAYPADIAGPVFVMFSMAVAAAEAAVGLALVFAIHRHYHTARLDRINRLKG
jgi:NADH-quinone oxidoreductase subunit K